MSLGDMTRKLWLVLDSPILVARGLSVSEAVVAAICSSSSALWDSFPRIAIPLTLDSGLTGGEIPASTTKRASASSVGFNHQ